MNQYKEMPVKVLQVIDILDAGGAERVMVDLTNILHENGVHVSALSIVKKGELTDSINKSVTQYCLNRKNKFSILSIFKLAKIVRNYDIIHVHMRHNLKYLWVVSKVFRFTNKIIFHDHFGNINTYNSIDKLLNKALKEVHYIGVSDQLCNWAVNEAKLSYLRVTLLENSIRRKKIKKVADKEDEMVLVSNFRAQKNIEHAINVFALHLLKNKSTKLDIYGQYTDDSYLNSIKEMISKKGLQDSIKIITNCTDIQSILPKYKLALHTAKSETGPLVLIEYLSAGLPFLSFNTGEVVKQVKQEFPEFVIDSFDVNEWNERLTVMLEQNSNNLRNKATSFFLSNYSSEKYLNKCMKIYKNHLNY